MGIFSFPKEVVARAMQTFDNIDRLIADIRVTVNNINKLVTRVNVLLIAFNAATKSANAAELPDLRSSTELYEEITGKKP